MYNTIYECVKPFMVYKGKERTPVKIERKTQWKLRWCGGQYSFKALIGKPSNKDKVLTISVPDEMVTAHFKKV